MIEVIKVINTQFPNRTEKIYSSIFGRTSDGELIAEKKGIIASQHIIAEIEPYIPKFAIKK
jgi:hypothetical protein